MGETQSAKCADAAVELDPRKVLFLRGLSSSVSKLGTDGICVFLSRDGEPRTECRKVPCRHFLDELFLQELENVLIGPRQFHNKSSCACTWTVKEHNINPEYEVGLKPTRSQGDHRGRRIDPLEA